MKGLQVHGRVVLRVQDHLPLGKAHRMRRAVQAVFVTGRCHPVDVVPSDALFGA